MSRGARATGIDRRATATRFVLLFLAAIVLVRLIDLQVVHGRDHLSSAERLRVRREPVPAARGVIVDREGRPLADNFASFAATLDPFDRRLRDARTLGRVIGEVARWVDRDSLELRERVRAARARSFHPVRLKRNLTPVEVACLEEARADLPGIEVRVEPLRRYPEGTLAAHVMGYMGERPAGEDRPEGSLPGESIGRSGVEGAFEPRLHGEHGVRFVEVDARGRVRTFSGVSPPVPAIPGQRLVTTIDMELQRVLESALDAVIAEANAERIADPLAEIPLCTAAAAVALDVWTGEIYAFASRPTFDPNAFARGMRPTEWQGLTSDPEHPLLNRVIQATYPPGSIFKMLVAVAALDAGVVTPATTAAACVGVHVFGDRAFGCWDRSGHGSMSMRDAIARSCDVYFYQLGEQLGVDGIASMAEHLDLHEVTGIDIRGEVPGLVPTAAYLDARYGVRGWGRGVALNHSIGQGEYLMTPLTMAVYTALIANGGARVTPHLWRRAEHVDGTTEVNAPSRVLVAPELHEELGLMRSYMRRAVEGDGTGRAARVSGLSVAGKTATAQNPHGEDHAIFASFAPADDPHLALVVVLERRGGGGRWAAPVAQRFWTAYREWRAAGEGEIG